MAGGDWQSILNSLPPEIAQQVQSNPTLLAAFKRDPEGTAALLTSGSGDTATDTSSPTWLAQQLVGSAMDVTGRQALVGHDYSGVIPSWAKGLSSQVLQSANFDPYLGILSEQGDERVYWKDHVTPAAPVTGPLNTGMAHAAPEQYGWTQDNAGAQTVTDKHGHAAQGTGDLEWRSGGQHQASDYVDHGPKKKKHHDKTFSATQVKNMPYLWDQGEVQSAMARMREAGLNVGNFDDLVSTWGSLVDRAAMTYSLSEGKHKVTPWDVLDMYKSEAKAGGSYTNYQNGTDTQTTKSVADISEGDAWSVLRGNLQQLLGRDPTDQELRDYTYRMNQLAAANPSISKTIAHYQGGQIVSQETQNESGFTAADMQHAAYEDAQNDPQYAEYQASSVYFNAAMSALGAIGGN